MTDFADLERRLGLDRFLAGPLGTLYFLPYRPGGPRVLVRHFDAALSPDLVVPYADLVRQAQRWIERHPDVDALARIEQPLDVGSDYVARGHHTYISDTDSFFDEEEPVEAPPEWERLQEALAAVPEPGGEHDAVLARLVTRTFGGPSGKVYFKESEGRFVAVDPALTADDVRQWAALS